MPIYEDAKTRLSSGGVLKCKDVVALLESLGFRIKNCGSAGHKVYKHDHIHGFMGGNFNCGHKSGDDVKKNYLKDMKKVLVKYETELKQHLGED